MRDLDINKLGVAFAVAWSLFTFLGGIAAAWLGWGKPLVEVLSSIYIGFDATLTGSIAGAVWGLANGYLWGALIAWIYNWQIREDTDS